MQIDVSYRRIALLTYPVVLATVCDTLMGTIDAVMVGRLGVTELAAVGLANIYTFCFLVVLIGLFTGVNTLVAQAYGAADTRACGVSFWQGAYLGLIAAVALAAVWPLVPGIYRLTGGSAEVQRLATGYMQIRLFSGLGMSLLHVSINFYRGLGRTIVPMWFALLQCVLNIGFNYCLIFGHYGFPALGTNGAAIGTVLALTLAGGALFASVVLIPGVRRQFHIGATMRFEPTVFRRLLRVGLPIGVQGFWDMASIVVFSALIARLGDAELAATNAGIQAWVIALMPTISLSVGATTLVGQCVGAGELAEARRVAGRLLRLGYVLIAGFAAAYLIAPGWIMGLFLRPEDLPQVLPYARPMLTIVVVCMAFEMQFNVGSGVLRGTGDTTYPMLLSIGVAWGIFVPLTVVATPRYGLIGAWACLIVFCALIAAGILLRLRGDRWLTRAQLPAPAAAGGS